MYLVICITSYYLVDPYTQGPSFTRLIRLPAYCFLSRSDNHPLKGEGRHSSAAEASEDAIVIL
jgi:hypothetical protein